MNVYYNYLSSELNGKLCYKYDLKNFNKFNKEEFQKHRSNPRNATATKLYVIISFECER